MDQESEMTPAMEEALLIINSDDLFTENDSNTDNNILFYVAGFNAHSMTKNLKFEDWKTLSVKDTDIPEFLKEESTETNQDSTLLKTMLFVQVNRGGLSTLTDLVYQSHIYNYNFYQTLHAHELFEEIYSAPNSKLVYGNLATSFVNKGKIFCKIFKTCCDKNHSFDVLFRLSSEKIFNIMTKNTFHL